MDHLISFMLPHSSTLNMFRLLKPYLLPRDMFSLSFSFSWSQTSPWSQSCSGGYFAVMIAYMINCRVQWNYLFPLMKSFTRISKQQIIDRLRFWVSLFLNPGELWQSCSVVIQMCFSGKILPTELSTNICVARSCWCFELHSIISVKLSTIQNSTGLRTTAENFCIMPVARV